MTHGSLFSGIGGFDLAAEWMGWENKFHCEWNEFGQKVLKYYFPKSELFTDITKSDFTKYANQIDILTGGFPCQPYSSAGKRLGKEDDRHLWPEMLRAIKEIKPRWVVGENVLGLVNWNGGLVFHEVQTDLEAQGYEVFPYVLPAVSVNAPHRRDRVWFVAYSRKLRLEFCKTSEPMGERQKKVCRERNKFTLQSSTESNIGNVTDSLHKRLQGGQKINEWQKCDTKGRRNGFDIRTNSKNFIKSTGCQFEKFPTVPPICNGDDGLSDRLDSITFSKWRRESIKAGGNAVVPNLVVQIFKAIEQYETLK